MARRSAENQSSKPGQDAEATHVSPLHDDEGLISFGADGLSGDTVIGVTDEVLALFGSVALPGHAGGLAASLGWNLFVFG